LLIVNAKQSLRGNCFLSSLKGREQEREEERVVEEDPIVVLGVFFDVPGNRACVRRVRFVVRSIAGYLFAQRLDP
jgi:hypothetical protein